MAVGEYEDYKAPDFEDNSILENGSGVDSNRGQEDSQVLMLEHSKNEHDEQKICLTQGKQMIFYLMIIIH